VKANSSLWAGIFGLLGEDNAVTPVVADKAGTSARPVVADKAEGDVMNVDEKPPLPPPLVVTSLAVVLVLSGSRGAVLLLLLLLFSCSVKRLELLLLTD